MSSKVTSACFKFAKFLLVISLMSNSFENKISLSKKHVGFLSFTGFSFFLYNGMQIYSAVWYSVSEISSRYSCSITTMYLLGSGLFYLQLIRQRYEVFVAMLKSEIVLQGLDSTQDLHPTRRRIFATLKIVLIMLCIVSAVLFLHINDYAYIVSTLETGMSLNTTVLTVSRIFSENVNFYYEMVMYGAIFCLLIEIEAAKCVFGMIFENKKIVWNQSIVQLFQGSSSEFNISNLVFNPSWTLKKPGSKSSGRLVVNVSSWKKLLELFLEIKHFHYSINKIFLKQYSYQTCLIIFSFPIALVFNNSTTQMDAESCVAQVLQSTLMLLPIVLNTFIMYTHNCSVTKLTREIFDYADIKARKTLRRFILLAKDLFPQSHNSLVDVDFEFLSQIIDFVILITTSLFVP